MKFLTRLIGCLLILGLCQCSEADEDTQQTPHSSLGFPSVQEGEKSPQIGAVGEVDFEIEDQTRLPILQTGIEKMSQSLYAIASSDRERSRKLYHKDSQSLLEGDYTQIQRIDEELDTLTAKRDGDRVWIHGVDVSEVEELENVGALLRAEAGRAVFADDGFHVNGSLRAVTFVDYDASGVRDVRPVETPGLERVDTVTDEQWLYAIEWLDHPMVGIFAVNLETEQIFEIQIETHYTFEAVPLNSGILAKSKKHDEDPTWWFVDPAAQEARPLSVPWSASKGNGTFHLLSNGVAIAPEGDEVHFVKSADEIVSIPCSGQTQFDSPEIPTRRMTLDPRPTTSRVDDPRFVTIRCGGFFSGQLVVFNAEEMEEIGRVDTDFLEVEVSFEGPSVVWTGYFGGVNSFSLERGWNTDPEVSGTIFYRHGSGAFLVFDELNEQPPNDSTLILPDGRFVTFPEYSRACSVLRMSSDGRAIAYIAKDRTLRYMDVDSGLTETLASNVFCDEIVARDDMRKGFVRYGAKFPDGVVEWAPDTSRNLFESNQIRELSQHGQVVTAIGTSADHSGSVDFLSVHDLTSGEWYEHPTLSYLRSDFQFDSTNQGWLAKSPVFEESQSQDFETWFGLWENPGWATNLGPGEFELRETAGEVWVVERRDEGDRFMELRPPQ